MAERCSMDLRERVVAAVEEESLSRHQAAARVYGGILILPEHLHNGPVARVLGKSEIKVLLSVAGLVNSANSLPQKAGVAPIIITRRVGNYRVFVPSFLS